MYGMVDPIGPIERIEVYFFCIHLPLCGGIWGGCLCWLESLLVTLYFYESLSV